SAGGRRRTAARPKPGDAARRSRLVGDSRVAEVVLDRPGSTAIGRALRELAEGLGAAVLERESPPAAIRILRDEHDPPIARHPVLELDDVALVVDPGLAP